MLYEKIKTLLKDSDVLFLISNGAPFSEYDRAADGISKLISQDLSISQIQNIIWEEFYNSFCVGTVGNSKKEFRLDKKAAVNIIGTADRYKTLATDIQKIVVKAPAK